MRNETTKKVTDAELLKSAERELAMRRKVYPRRVDQGTMSPEAMAHEIACQERVVEILRDRVEPGLF